MKENYKDLQEQLNDLSTALNQNTEQRKNYETKIALLKTKLKEAKERGGISVNGSNNSSAIKWYWKVLIGFGIVLLVGAVIFNLVINLQQQIQHKCLFVRGAVSNTQYYFNKNLKQYNTLKRSEFSPEKNYNNFTFDSGWISSEWYRYEPQSSRTKEEYDQQKQRILEDSRSLAERERNLHRSYIKDHSTCFSTDDLQSKFKLPEVK